MLMKMFCAGLLFFIAAGCVYTDAYGVVPPGTISGRQAIEEIGGAAAFSFQAARHIITDYSQANIPASCGGFFGVSQTNIQMPIL